MSCAKKKTPKTNGAVATVGDLTPNPQNPRQITPEKLAMLGASLEEHGDLSGIVRNVRTGNLCGGHQRVKKLDPSWKIVKHPATDKTGTVALGAIETPWGLLAYREVNWSQKKERTAMIAANQHGGEFDSSLASILSGMSDADRLLAGFESSEVESLLARLTAPDEFATVGDDIETDHVCPKCGFAFSGGRSSKPE